MWLNFNRTWAKFFTCVQEGKLNQFKGFGGGGDFELEIIRFEKKELKDFF